MKKKFVVLVAACLAMMMLVACGSAGGKEVPTPTATEAPTSTPTPEPTATSTPTPEPTSTPTPEPTATSPPTPEPTATPVPEVTDSYVKGQFIDTGFESEWMNLKFTTQSDVTMVSQAELDVLMMQGANMLYGDNAEIRLDYAKLTTVTEMMAKHVGGANVIVQVELLPALYSSMTEEEYANVIMENMRNSAAGFDVATDGEFYQVEIGGENYTGISTAIDYGNGLYIGQEYIVRRKENRMISIVVSYTEESMENAKDLLRVFGAYGSEPIYLETKEPEVEPTTAPAEGTTGFSTGVITDTGYENEWMGLRFVTPEGATIVPEESVDGIYMHAEWSEYGIPVVQVMAEELGISLTEEEFFAELKTTFDGSYLYDDEYYTADLAGQEFTCMKTAVDIGNGMYAYQEFCLREKDGYMIAIIFTYTDGFETEMTALFDAFRAY